MTVAPRGTSQNWQISPLAQPPLSHQRPQWELSFPVQCAPAASDSQKTQKLAEGRGEELACDRPRRICGGHGVALSMLLGRQRPATAVRVRACEDGHRLPSAAIHPLPVRRAKRRERAGEAETVEARAIVGSPWCALSPPDTLPALQPCWKPCYLRHRHRPNPALTKDLASSQQPACQVAGPSTAAGLPPFLNHLPAPREAARIVTVDRLIAVVAVLLTLAAPQHSRSRYQSVASWTRRPCHQTLAASLPGTLRAGNRRDRRLRTGAPLPICFVAPGLLLLVLARLAALTHIRAPALDLLSEPGATA